MKKVLLNTTALLATAGMSLLVTAGIASADVSLSGFAEIGIVGGDGSETAFHSDLDVKFSLTAETDGGLSYGATIDLDEVASGIDASGGPASVFISGGFGTLTMGDTDGAFDWALKEAIIGGTINDVQEHVGYSGNSGLDGTYDGQIARYDNTIGALGFALSVELDDSGADGDAVVGGGVRYSMGDFGIGLAVQSDGVDDISGISVDGSFGDISVVANYADLDSSGTTAGFAVGYTMGDLTVAGNWGQKEPVAGATSSGWGAIVNFDLGGGAVLQAGYGSSDTAGVDTSSVSVGLAISF